MDSVVPEFVGPTVSTSADAGKSGAAPPDTGKSGSAPPVGSTVTGHEHTTGSGAVFAAGACSV